MLAKGPGRLGWYRDLPTIAASCGVDCAACGRCSERGLSTARRSPLSQHREVPGAIAQLGEQLLCKQKVVGSIPTGSTKFKTSFSVGRYASAVEREPLKCGEVTLMERWQSGLMQRL